MTWLFENANARRWRRTSFSAIGRAAAQHSAHGPKNDIWKNGVLRVLPTDASWRTVTAIQLRSISALPTTEIDHACHNPIPHRARIHSGEEFLMEEKLALARNLIAQRDEIDRQLATLFGETFTPRKSPPKRAFEFIEPVRPALRDRFSPDGPAPRMLNTFACGARGWFRPKAPRAQYRFPRAWRSAL